MDFSVDYIDIGLFVPALLLYSVPRTDSGNLQGEEELALVCHTKVSLPQGEPQINDQGR